LCATCAADVFPHIAGRKIVPFVTNGRKPWCDWVGVALAYAQVILRNLGASRQLVTQRVSL